jgi:hypothetical protein
MMIRSVRGDLMAPFWIVHEIDGKRCIFIQEAGALITARIKASIAGFDEGTLVEAHTLDAKDRQLRLARPVRRIC